MLATADFELICTHPPQLSEIPNNQFEQSLANYEPKLNRNRGISTESR